MSSFRMNSQVPGTSISEPISDKDILRKLNGNTRIIFYEELNNHEDIIPLLDKGSLVILYRSKPNFGHWTALVKTPEGIEYFDPYGEMIEEAKRNVNRDFLRQTNQQRNRLAELLFRASRNVPIHYNDHKLQKRSKTISTCGKHVIVRIMHRYMTIDEYNKELRDVSEELNMTPDEVVNTIYNIF